MQCHFSFGDENCRLYGQKFCCTATQQRSRKNVICDHKIDDLPPQMTISITVSPILMRLFIFFLPNRLKIMLFGRKNMNKRIRMGLTVMKIVIWGGKSSILWSQITFYGSAVASPYNKISNHKANNLHPQMTILNTDIHQIALPAARNLHQSSIAWVYRTNPKNWAHKKLL